MCIPGPVPGHGAEETTSAWRSGAEAEGEEGRAPANTTRFKGDAPFAALGGMAVPWRIIVQYCTHLYT